MPILLHGKCYRTFRRAATAVQRRKGWGKKRAAAYVATVERRQRGSRRLRKTCRRR